MNINSILLIFFAIPLAVVIFSIAIQKILKNPFLVASIIFSILLIIVLAFFEPIFLVLVIAYAILAFITAIITKIIRNMRFNFNSNNNANNNFNPTVENNEDLIAVSANDNNKFLNTETNYNYNCRWKRNREY